MDVCRFSEARYRSQVFTPPCVQSSATPPPSLQVGLTLSSSFAPRPLSKLMALSLASVLNSRVSSRLFPWTNSKPWCLLTIYWLSGKRIATYHKVLPDSKNWKISIESYTYLSFYCYLCCIVATALPSFCLWYERMARRLDVVNYRQWLVIQQLTKPIIGQTS